MSDTAKYSLPEGGARLTGPVTRPAPGALPLRGDLAHIALAGTHLAAHYVVPIERKIGSEPAPLLLQPRADADVIITLDAGTQFEALDYAGDWCWGCCGPDGPAGYVLLSQLAD